MFLKKRKRSNRTFKEIYKGVQGFYYHLSKIGESIQGLKEKTTYALIKCKNHLNVRIEI